MNQLNPGIIKHSQLIGEIESGRIKIPQFQREFVWSKKKSAELLDSIIKRYPIGTFILWKTNESLRSIRNIGGIEFPQTPEGDYIQYILDGQQRITSLYAGFKGSKIIGLDNRTEDYSEIYIDLEADDDREIVTIEIEQERSFSFIKVTELLNGGLSLAEKFPSEYHKKIEEYKTRFAEYTYQTISVSEAPIDIATEIFTRVNVGGKSLSVFEIMVAKTFDLNRGFDLSEKYEQLIERLEPVKYDTISRSTVLQSVSVCMIKECTAKHIFRLEKKEFVDIFDNVIEALENAVDYFRKFFRIPVSQLLPYNSLLIPFTYYFFNHPDRPSGESQERLEDFFWRIIINSRYSGGLETKIAQDIKKIDSILAGSTVYEDDSVDVSVEAIWENGYFSAGRAYIKGLLCILAFQQPKSFDNNALVAVDNSYLKQANSKNYHHFFPRAYLRKKGFDEFEINHIANITIVDDFLNKRMIKDSAPSKYIKEFEAKNPELGYTLKSHLIGDIDAFGVRDNDYGKFVDQRLEEFANELRKRLIISKKDIIKRTEYNA